MLDMEEALRGRVARSYEALAALPGPVLAKIDAAIPHLLIAEGVGGTWDITRHMRDAIDLLMEFRASGEKVPETFLGRVDMLKGSAPTERYSQAARALFRMAMGMPKAAFAGAFARYAGHAKASPEAGSIPGVTLTQEQAAREFLGIEPETGKEERKAAAKVAPEEPPAKGADPFGPAYAAFSGKPAEAIEHLLKVRQGHVPAAFHKEGLGDIDLPWGKGGKGGFGLAHIIERRNESGVDGEAFARSLPKLIQEGKVEKRPNYPGRAYIVSEKQESAIRLEWNGEKRNWIVTAYPLNKETLEATGGLRTSAHAYGDKQSFPLPHSEGVENNIPPAKAEGKTDGTKERQKPEAPRASLASRGKQERLRESARRARNDVAILRRAAGVPETGALDATQWETVQEFTARGFEKYLAEGNAPSKELEGVFARMKRWLLRLYASWKDYLGGELSDDVRRVFDRMLAAEKAFRATLTEEERAVLRREEERLAREMEAVTGSRDKAESNARLFAAHASAFADAYGADPVELMRNVRVEAGTAENAPVEGGALFQPTREEIRAGDEALKRDAAAWAGTVDGIAKAGVAPRQPVKMLGQTPLVMGLLGKDTVTGKAAAQGGIYAAPHVFDGTHPNMTPDMWKQLPEAMADPIAIFDSDSPTGRANGDLVFMLELTDANGATVVVPVALDTESRNPQYARINIIKSAYSKERGGAPSNHWFAQQAKKNARYVNGQKLKRWQGATGVQFPVRPISNASGNTVITEADLVKLREANPTLYQTAYHGSPHRFSQFTLDHIGTGEGAQAHGWGLYFAREKNIANDYRERLRKGRSRGQLFEVDIPENDVLVDEQKSFSQQPDAVQKALRHIYRGFSGEQLRPVRDEQKERVRPDRKMLEEIHALELELQEVRRGRNALETINAEKPAGDARNPFGNASRFARWEENLKRLYTEEQRERLRNDPAFLEKEKAAKEEQFAALEAKIAEARDALQARVEKTRAAIDRADIDTLLEGMDGAELYSGLDIVTGSRREASLLLNANGIKGITYDGQQDGRCFVVFDDKAIETLNTFYQRTAAGSPRASVTFDPDGGAVMRLFKGADASSIPHEAAHIFLDDLRRVAESDGVPSSQGYGFVADNNKDVARGMAAEGPRASLASAAGGERRAYPYNGREVGSVTPEIAARLHLDKPGPIVLDDTGLRHIEERHGEQIRGLGFADARSFVRFVLAQVDAVYDVDGKGRKYDVVTRAMTPMGRVMVRLEFAEEGDFYSVATAGPLRKNQYANKKPLWEGAHSTRFPEETPWATRRASQRGQSGDSRQSAANSPTVEASGGGVNLAAGRFLPQREAGARPLPASREALRRVVDKLNARAANGADVRLADTMDDLPAHLRKAFDGKAVEGVYDPETGTVWLVADQLGDPQRAAEVWAHETLAHHGLRALLNAGERKLLLNQLWLQMGGMGHPLIAETARRYGIDPRSDVEGRLTVMEEALAKLAERRAKGLLNAPDKAPEQSLWRRVVAAVLRAWQGLVKRLTGREGSMDAAGMERLLDSLQGYVMDGRPMEGAARAADGNAAKAKEAPTASLDSDRKAAAHAAWRQLQRDTEQWARQVEEFATGKGNTIKPLQVCSTPDVLVQLGASQLPMQMEARNLRKILSKHQVPLEALRDLPSQLAQPLMVFKSATMANSYMAILEQERHGENLAAAIHLNVQAGRLYVNDIASIHDRSTERDGKTIPGWVWVKGQIEKGNLRYYDKTRSPRWFRERAGLQLPSVVNSGDYRGIKILTEKDIVKPEAPTGERPLASLRSAPGGDAREQAAAVARRLRAIAGRGVSEDVEELLRDPEQGRLIPREDLGKLERLCKLPHWIAKDHPKFAAIYNRQLRRVDERRAALLDATSRVPLLFDGDAKARLNAAEYLPAAKPAGEGATALTY